MTPIQAHDLRRARMRSQLLATRGAHQTPAAIAQWFGAMQAQDLQSGLWSFGVRLPAMGLADVEAAVADGEVLRTWPMRGTIHFVAAPDARWLLRTTGAKALRTTGARWRNLGLDEATAARAADTWGDVLADGGRLTRTAMLAAIRAAGIDTSGQRGYHLLWYASQIGVTCIGPNEGNEQTFVLLSQWAPDQLDLQGEEALAELALRYFRSHGPTSRQDFMAWSGLSAAQARTGINASADRIVEVDGGERPLFAAPEALEPLATDLSVRLLPAFDEFVLGYRDRSAFIPDGRKDAIVPGGNGVFRPTVVVDGMVIGTWTRRLARGRAALSIDYFEPPDRPVPAAVHEAAEAYGRFLGLPVVV